MSYWFHITHSPTSHTVFSYNDSGIYTLNGKPENIRSKRSTFTFFDESAFSSEELLTAAIAFSTQDMDFSTSTEEGYDVREQKLRCPTQLLFASSQNDRSCLFYRKFKDYALRMFAGDKNYYVCSIPCDIPLAPLMDGKPYTPLLKRTQIESELATNRQKALREYFCIPSEESEFQMIKQSMITKNSTLLLPELYNIDNKSKYILASDPARVGDNSIFGVMKLCFDDKIGYYGEVVNCVNFIDIGKKKKMSIKIPDQLKLMKEYILAYNGEGYPDYENIEGFLMDAGSGGQPNGFTDNMMDDWEDEKGNAHKGFIDETHETYTEEAINYPNASRKLTLVNPKRYRNQMCEELIELMSLDLIKFPKEYNGKDSIVVETTNKNGEFELKDRPLSLDEQLALINIDIMKTEVTQIHVFKDPAGNVSRYTVPDPNIHDDRFYVLLLLAHKLYEIRRANLISKKRDGNYDYVFEYD